MPTPENFDELFKKFGSAAFSAEPESWTLDSDAPNPSDANETYRYEVRNYLVQLVLNCFIKRPSKHCLHLLVKSCSSSEKEKLYFGL